MHKKVNKSRFKYPLMIFLSNRLYSTDIYEMSIMQQSLS